MKLYSVYDKEARIYNTPFPAATDVHAMRTFSMQVNDANSANMLNFAPKDFALYSVGSFDSNTGELTPHSPMLLVEAEKIIRKENN